MNSTETIRWQQDTDGVVVLTFDDPNQSANTMNANYFSSMNTVLDRLEAEIDSVTGVVLASAKNTFFAGGDLNDLVTAGPGDAQKFTDFANGLKSQLRRLETLNRPVVAAINGAALGGGLEIALAAHHRIAVDHRAVVVGLPEVTLGLLPGAGGIVRTVRLLGIQKALTALLLHGQRRGAAQAAELGLIDELVTSADDLLPAAKSWIQAHPDARQPWDLEKHKIPGGTPADPVFAANLPALPALLRKQLRGAPLSAPRAILAAAVEGAQVDFDTASLIETRYFVSLATDQVSSNMIKANFFDLARINSGESRPDGIDRVPVTKVGVLGAGMMGAGIAYVSAKAGIHVVLKDTTLEAAERGKKYAQSVEAKALKAGRTDETTSQALLDRIHPTDDPTDFAGVDFVIEAVFEDPGLKQSVFQEIQDIVDPDAILASNTSTLPISDLAEEVKKQDKFIGLHFFSPADKMPLVEIIRGQNTSDETLARTFDYARQIRKTPIVVNDSRGFFTTRVIIAFLNEAVGAVAEGVDPATVEQAALQIGYLAGPLQLIDELTARLVRKIRLETRAATEAAGEPWTPHHSEAVIDKLVEQFGRPGRAAGAGFYDYDDNGTRLGLWPGLRTEFTKPEVSIPFVDLQERLLFAEAIETVRCFDEGVLTSVADANVGSLLGIGYPSWTGGVVQYINGHPGGPAGFVIRAHELADRYGDHLRPPASLEAVAATGGILE
ncbi:3-hydroxyacyl-CoA dehydrogenase NAD-binding domain-containing protein [Rhodococcus sp. NPDC057014]|uniref:3-hydroxyacyl-CoA dehydrogenase NAD-binding domain-containing protein n=1 Tax=Rhodococcus sp. NPDC057014 TaxID=3346000 RepID=UPI003641EBA1